MDAFHGANYIHLDRKCHEGAYLRLIMVGLGTVLGLVLLMWPVSTGSGLKDINKVNVRATGVQIRQETKERVEEMRQGIEAERIRLRNELQTRLELFKDERKKEIVEKINTNLCKVNTNRVDNATRQLTKMSQIIARVETRGQEEATKGADLAKLNTAVANAKKAVGDAQTVVNAQSTATCTIEISGDEVKVRAEVRAQINTLAGEIKKVNDVVYKARRATVEAIKQLAWLLGEEVD